MSLKKTIAINYIGLIYNSAIGIVMIPIYIKYLGAESYGLIGFFLVLQSWMSLLDMGLSPTLAREVAILKTTTESEKRKLFKLRLHSLEFIFIAISITISITISLASELISTHWLKTNNLDIETVSKCISLMGIISGSRVISSLYTSGIVGYNEQVWLNISTAIANTLRFVGVILIFEIINPSIVLFFVFQLILSIVFLYILGCKFYNLVEIKKFQLIFSYGALKPIIPFAISIAYTGGIWTFLTQIDKLLLSHFLSLQQFGYFSIITTISNALLQISNPIGQALLPRFVNLAQSKNINEFIILYRKSSRLMAAIMFSSTLILAVYSKEILLLWTNDLAAAEWGFTIMSLYVLGNGILSLSGLQYGIQYAFGNLKYHIKYNTVIAIISLPLSFYLVPTYGALGAAFFWLAIRIFGFIFWVPFIHKKFFPGTHLEWLLKDILPIAVFNLTASIIVLYSKINIDNKINFIFLIGLLGLTIFIANLTISKYIFPFKKT